MGLFKKATPECVMIREKQLLCLVCGHDEFWIREAQLNTAVASFLNFDWANATANCFICDGCGHIHWFMPKR